MAKSRLYVEGASRNVDDLARTYEKIENVPAWTSRPVDESERNTKDPLGLKTKKKEGSDAFADGKEAAVRLTKFVAYCALELELAAEQTIFAVELTALNTLNAKDCPVRAERVEQIREAAYKYYKASLSKIPDPT